MNGMCPPAGPTFLDREMMPLADHSIVPVPAKSSEVLGDSCYDCR